jgi:hypothetical protein
MTKSYGGLLADAKPATEPHPLESVVRKIFAKELEKLEIPFWISLRLSVAFRADAAFWRGCMAFK